MLPVKVADAKRILVYFIVRHLLVVSIGHLTAFYVIFVPPDHNTNNVANSFLTKNPLFHRYLWLCKILNTKSGVYLLSMNKY